MVAVMRLGDRVRRLFLSLEEGPTPRPAKAGSRFDPRPLGLQVG